MQAREEAWWMAAIHTWEECIPLSEQPAHAECGSQVEWIELFTILIWNATFLVSVAKTVNNFVGGFQWLLVWRLLNPSWIYFCRTRRPFVPLGHCSFLVEFRDLLLQFSLFWHEQSIYSLKGNTMTQLKNMRRECRGHCVCGSQLQKLRVALFARLSTKLWVTGHFCAFIVLCWLR